MDDNSIDEALALSEMDTERYIAIRNGEEIFHSDAYFNARADFLDTIERRRIFEAGFNRGFDAATERLRADLAAAQKESEYHKFHKEQALANWAAAQEELRKAREHKGVAWVHGKTPSGRNHIISRVDLPIGTELYAAPVPAILSEAPEGMAMVCKEWLPIIAEVDRRAGKEDGRNYDFTVVVTAEEYRAADDADRLAAAKVKP